MSPFGGAIRLYRTGCRGTLQSGDGTQDPLAMSEQHAEFLEIRLRQLGQSLDIDAILSRKIVSYCCRPRLRSQAPISKGALPVARPEWIRTSPQIIVKLTHRLRYFGPKFRL